MASKRAYFSHEIAVNERTIAMLDSGDFDDLRRLTKRVPNQWALCELFKDFKRASEMEFIAGSTLHACVNNLDRHGKAFSFVSNSVTATSGGGLVDNATAWSQLKANGFIDAVFVAEGAYSPVPDDINNSDGSILICWVTRKLLDRLKGHFARMDVKDDHG